MSTANAANTTADIHEIAGEANKKINQAVTGGSGKKITWWGFAWRTATITLLFFAAIVAVVIGMHFAIAYVAGLGLTAGVTTCLQYLIAIIGYLAAGYAGVKTSEKVGGVYADFSATRAEAKAKAQS